MNKPSPELKLLREMLISLLICTGCGQREKVTFPNQALGYAAGFGDGMKLQQQIYSGELTNSDQALAEAYRMRTNFLGVNAK